MTIISSQRKAILIFAISAVLWLGTMALLYRREVAPAETAGPLSAPLIELNSSLLFREEWMGILYQGRQHGYLHTALYPHQEKGFYGPALENSLWLDLPLPGLRNQIRSYTLCLFSSAGEIHRLDLKISGSNPSFTMEGRTEGKTLKFAIRFGSDRGPDYV